MSDGSDHKMLRYELLAEERIRRELITKYHKETPRKSIFRRLGVSIYSK